MFLERLFAPSGKYEAYEMFTPEHWITAVISFIATAVALYLSRNMTEKKVFKTLKTCIVTLWIFETIKIAFNLYIGNADDPHTYIPLYFCSITLFAGIFSCFAHKKLKRASDVFIAVGGIVGGVAYIISPNTTAGVYPIFHYITEQSFLYHSMMIYLGALFIITGYVNLKASDWKYYATFVTIMCLITHIVNTTFDLNFMFLSETYPGTPVDWLYKLNPKFFSVNMTLVQAFPPFFVVYLLSKLFKRKNNLKIAE